MSLKSASEVFADVIVVGGGLAGTCAAISAARLGASVVLVHERPVLGGNSSSEIRVGPSGASQVGYHRDSRETGIIEELFLETRARTYGLRQANGHHYPMWDVVLEEKVRDEENISLLLDTRVIHVACVDDGTDEYERRIESLIAVQQGTEATFRLVGTEIVDATGDGFVAFQAGVPFRYGREARSEFGESWAPERADEVVLGSSIMFAARDVGRQVPFTPPAWAHAFPDEEALPFRSHEQFDVGYWWIEWGGRLDTIRDNRQIRLELQAAVFGVWDHIKNHCTVPGVRERAATWALDWIGHTPGKRESRRFEGDYLMSEVDVVHGIDSVPADVVAYGGWPIDLHAEDGVYSPEQPCTQPPLRDRYGIPLRSLYARTVSNLFLAGRNISQTHVAHGSTRVMKTCAVIGEGVGVAAALAARSHRTPRSLVRDPSAVQAIQQQLLRQGAYLPTVRNADDCDLVQAPDVRISATSEARLEVEVDVPPDRAWEVFGLSSIETDVLAADQSTHPDGRPMPLTQATAQAVVISGVRLEGISTLLGNETDRPQSVTFHLRQADHLRDFGDQAVPMEPLATVSVTVPVGVHWVDLPLERPMPMRPDHPLILHAEPAPGTNWRSTLQEPYGTQAGIWDAELGHWRWIHGTLGFRMTPASAPYGAATVASGMTRAERAAELWVSDPREELPQVLEIEWSQSQQISRVELTFDSQLSGWIWEGVFPHLARDYSVEVRAADNTWQIVDMVVGNTQRRRVHQIEMHITTGLRISVTATNGGPAARIVEVRAYGPSEPAAEARR